MGFNPGELTEPRERPRSGRAEGAGANRVGPWSPPREPAGKAAVRPIQLAAAAQIARPDDPCRRDLGFRRLPAVRRRQLRLLDVTHRDGFYLLRSGRDYRGNRFPPSLRRSREAIVAGDGG